MARRCRQTAIGGPPAACIHSGMNRAGSAAKGDTPDRKERTMKISARNQLKGTVSAVTNGAVNGVVAIDIGGSTVKADITMEAIKDLGLAEGVPAVAVIKASNVMFAVGAERVKGLSARNQLAGKVASVTKGAVNGHVVLELVGGNRIMGSVTNEAIEDLGLAEGAEALAVVKSTDVIVGVE